MFSNSQFCQTTWKATEGKANVSLIKCNLLFQWLNRLLAYDSELFCLWIDATIIYTTVMKKCFWSASLLRNTEALVAFSDGRMKPVFKKNLQYIWYMYRHVWFAQQEQVDQRSTFCHWLLNADVLVRMVNPW